MKMLIIGADSYVGARVYFEISKKYETIGTYYQDKLSKRFLYLDITDRNNVNKLITKQQPTIIIHVANNSSAKWCKENKKKAIEINQKSTEFIVQTANLIKAKMIYISSFSAIEYADIYGKTKFESEQIIKKVRAGYLILRLSLVLGFSPNTKNDRPFNRLLKNLDQSTQAIYDISWKFKLTYLGHVCEVIAAAIDKDIWFEKIPVAVEGLRTRYEVAKDILSYFNIKVKKINNQDKTPINRENLSKLKNLKLPTYTYNQVIKKIIEEIKNRNDFKL
ncbi:MAG: sugar nucleotide-binding protein [bacterium]|nr:sugar nucleotide-binding protein [bacterium]